MPTRLPDGRRASPFARDRRLPGLAGRLSGLFDAVSVVPVLSLCFYDCALFVRDAIEPVNQMVDLGIGGGDFSLQAFDF